MTACTRFVRSLATATPVVNANLRLVARNNEVLGTAKTDSRGYAPLRCRPQARRGRSGAGRAGRRARPTATTPSSTSSTAAFDLTDRGVKGRAAPGPIDAFAYTDRGVYRPGETGAPDGAGARRAPARPRPFPSPSSSPAPMASSIQRVTLCRPGPGRPRHHARACRLRHDRHLARQGAHRSQGQPDRAGRLPGRGLRARAARAQARARRAKALTPAAARHHQARRAATSTGRPPPALPSRARSPSSRPTKDVPGFAGYKFGLADEQISSRAQAAGRPARHRRRRQGRHRACACRPCPRPAGHWRPT